MARIYVDTSAFYSLLVRDDSAHARAKETLEVLRAEDATLVTSNYVVHETIALLQHRWGIEAVRVWEHFIEPALEMVWADADIHGRAMGTLLAAAERGISLTDWASFEIMRRERIARVFAFDKDFENRGFEVIPATV
ncbi:MAG TPA: PIN domain-containing protein [Gemmatimonadota bacterium]|nr:PIN domain-containing protein [Gemmatimonadota bacterium]